MRLHVEVTAEDIAAGEKGNCYACPIALAASRAAGRPIRVDLGSLLPWGRRELILLPAPATDFISRFDAGFHVEPFGFDVDLD